MSQKKILSSLTFEELNSRKFKFDLGPGYPSFKGVAEWNVIKESVLHDPYAMDSSRGWGQCPTTQDLSLSLKSSLSKIIGLNEKYQVFPVATGSLALHRAIAASKNHLCRTGHDRIKVIATSPCIDIIPAIAFELTNSKPLALECKGTGAFNSSEAKRLLDKISETLVEDSASGVIVVLTSPENPTGRIWPLKVIESLLTEVDIERVIFVFDHCFLFSGIQEYKKIPCVWNVDFSKKSAEWISILDTGKVFDLDGEKLGFLVGSSKEIENLIENSISILQYDISEREKIIFNRIFSSPELNSYFAKQSEICNKNLSVCKDYLADVGVNIYEPLAGSLVLASLPSTLSVREYMLRSNSYGVGLISADHFFWNDSDLESRNLIRIALNRDTDYFASAIHNLCKAWG